VRRSLVAIPILVVSAALVSSTPAQAVPKEYVQLNASGRTAVVTQPEEVPTWFGPVKVVQEPEATSGSREGIFRVDVCKEVGWTPTNSQAVSIYSAGTKTTIDSVMFQYPSPDKAEAAWTSLVARLDRCQTTGSTSGDGSTARYYQQVESLPTKYGTGGFTVFQSIIGTGEQESQWSYEQYRLVGAAIILTDYARSLPSSVKTPPTKAPFRATATVRILNDRSTYRYRQLAYKAL
jgi:hypothetical protein